jgi:ATP synthase protein I
LVQHITKTNRQKALKFLLWQLSLGLVLTTLVGLIWEVHIAKSFLLGVMLDVLPSFVFTIYAFRFGGAQKLQHVAASFYRGETVKIMLTGAMLIAIIKMVPVVFPALLIGFLIMKISQFTQTIFF